MDQTVSELKILHTRTPHYNPSSNIVERWHRTIVSILRTKGREMQNEWDLGIKAPCLAYNTTVHSSTGQTPFFATFGREVIVPIHWVYPIPRQDAEKDVSAWTETIQERFQTAYAGMRDRQQQMVRRNAQYYKPILNQFNLGQWVLVRLLAPALAEVMAVYEQGKPRIVSLDIFKEFRGENNVHGLPSDPTHPAFQGGDEITEIPSSELEKPITEGINNPERQSDKRERDPGDRRDAQLHDVRIIFFQ